VESRGNRKGLGLIILTSLIIDRYYYGLVVSR